MTEAEGREVIITQCVECGNLINRTRRAIREAERKGRGGCCCKRCKYEKVSAGNRGKTRTHGNTRLTVPVE